MDFSVRCKPRLNAYPNLWISTSISTLIFALSTAAPAIFVPPFPNPECEIAFYTAEEIFAQNRAALPKLASEYPSFLLYAKQHLDDQLPTRYEGKKHYFDTNNVTIIRVSGTRQVRSIIGAWIDRVRLLENSFKVNELNQDKEGSAAKKLNSVVLEVTGQGFFYSSLGALLLGRQHDDPRFYIASTAILVSSLAVSTFHSVISAFFPSAQHQAERTETEREIAVEDVLQGLTLLKVEAASIGDKPLTVTFGSARTEKPQKIFLIKLEKNQVLKELDLTILAVEAWLETPE